MSRYGRILVPIGWLVLMPVPILVFFWVGLIKISLAHGTLISHGALHDTTAPGDTCADATLAPIAMAASGIAATTARMKQRFNDDFNTV